MANTEQWRSRLRRDRERLSKALHDHVGQGLTAVGLELHLAALDFGAQAPELPARLAEVQEHLEASFAIIRDLSREFHHDPAVRFGLTLALEMLGERFAKLYPGQLRTEIDLPPQGIPEAVARAAYDIADVALDNVLRHAESSEATLGARCENGCLRVWIQDNGRGFEKTSVAPGTGGAILDYHVKSTRATCVVRSGTGQGTLVQLTVNV